MQRDIGIKPTADEFSARDLALIERSTQEVGRALFARLAPDRPAVWQRRWWDDRLMSAAMADESVKVQMFRFIDVLPMLRTNEEIVRHLHEYFAEVRERLPHAVRLGLAVTGEHSLLGRAVAVAARRNAMAHARRFIAGSTPQEVLATAFRERRLKRAFTLDLLGEAVTSDVEADRYLQGYLDLIASLAPTVNSWPEVPQIDRHGIEKLPRLNLSVKLSALDSQFDPVDTEGTIERVGERLRPLLRAAREAGAHVHVDMESYRAKTLTLEIFQRVLAEEEFRDMRDVGIVIQVYLREAEQDLIALRDWAQRRGTPVWVRLVKGAYWDYETISAEAANWPIPVWQEKWQSDANFERLARFLLLNRSTLNTALASHNIRSLAHGVAVARHLGMAPHDLELQMLYGMADAEKQAWVDLGYRLRIYMPFGELIPGMAYLVRRLLENTSNDSFLRASFAENILPEKLLMNPTQNRPPFPPTDEAKSKAIASSLKLASTVGRYDTPWPEFRNEPHTDFAQPTNRKAFVSALEAVRRQFGGHTPLRIGSRWIDTQARIASHNPTNTKELVGTTAAASVADAQLAVESALDALPAWSALGAERRGEYLIALANAMRERRFELSAWEVYECGKVWREADADVAEAIDFCEYYARAAVELEQPQGTDVPGEENRLDYLPRGVAAVIAPWNFPLAILTGMTTAALATGNTVIMKPAEQSSVIAARLMELLVEVGLPPGVVNFLPGQGEVVGAALVEHPDVALIAFTGSREVGLAINRRAADVTPRGRVGVKRVIAEMGGKNAIIVDDDADLDEAVLAIVRSAFGYQGQKCSACSRSIVLQSNYEPLLARLVEATRSLKVGLAEDPATSVGPVIDAASRKRIEEFIALGRREARLILAMGAADLAKSGHFVAPHIFADVPPQCRLAQEEIFGPVLAVIRAKDFEEAVAIANGTDYALTAGVFSRSPAHLEQARRALLAGNIYLNRGITGAMVGRQPFGGFKMSGIGSKAGGPDYLLQFVVPRTVTENTLRRGFAPSAEADADAGE